MEEAVKGYHEAGLMTSVKHFPGHGDTAVDSHVGLPIVDFDKERLDKIELIPFKKVVDLIYQVLWQVMFFILNMTINIQQHYLKKL